MKSPRFWLPVGLVVVLGSIGVIAAILSGRALAAKDAIEMAMPLADDVKQQMLVGDTAGAAETALRISKYTKDARVETDSALWRAVEWFPIAGANLQAVRIAAESADDLVTGVLQPATGLSIEVLKPQDGRIDTAAVSQMARAVDSAAETVREVEIRLAAIDRSVLIGPVESGVSRLDQLLEELRPVLDSAQKATSVLPRVLGADGPQTVALVFLNNAEAAPLGGGPAAQSLLTVNDGAISVSGELSSVDFPQGIPLGIPMDDSANLLYDDILTQHINGATSRPDFPTAARILSAQIMRASGTVPNTIVSIDPLALSKMLAVTGPISLPDGTELNSGNVVSVLLNQAYFLYPDGEESDAFFAGAASAIFDRVLNVDYDLSAMMTALGAAADQGSIMVWSADPEIEALLDGERLQGVLPKSNAPETVLGVYFRDRSASKIDYYLHSDTTVTTNACAPDSPSYTVETHLRFDIPENIELPKYIDSNLFDFYRTEVFLYGPVGGSIASTETPVVGVESVVGPGVTDLNRPAQKFVVDLLNGQDAVVKATFAGTPEAGPYGPPVVRTTPMINPTTVTMAEASCG